MTPEQVAELKQACRDRADGYLQAALVMTGVALDTLTDEEDAAMAIGRECGITAAVAVFDDWGLLRLESP